MTSTSAQKPSEDDHMIAGEYVLGTLDWPDRIAAETRLRNDAGFAALVQQWQNRLADLNDDYPEAQAPNLLPQIEARLFPQPHRRRGWFVGLMGLGATIAATLAVVAFFVLAPPTPSLTALLVADGSDMQYQAAIAGEQLTLTRLAGSDAGAGKDYELWIIVGDSAPVSLGLLRADKVSIPAPVAAAGYVLAVTLEPEGGGPQGKPTGPIVAAGPLQSS